MENSIEISHLYKRFGDVQAVKDLSFTVHKGQFFAFLGVNGAGKSTTISIICGEKKSDGGTVKVSGADVSHNADSVKRDLGVVFQSSVLDMHLSVRDNLICRAALYGITGKAFEDVYAELDGMLNLSELGNRTVGKLSGGQRRRVDIARALLHKPKILILDEPTTGLDPQTRRTIWSVVHKLRKEREMTVLLTTHYMEEAADADYVLIIDAGQACAEGTPLDLKNKYTGDFITLYNADIEEVNKLGYPTEQIPDAVRISVPSTAVATELIVKHPALFRDYEVTKGKMDDVFLAVTGKRLAGTNV